MSQIIREYIHTVPSFQNEKERLSKYVIGKFLLLESGSAVKNAIARGELLLNGSVGHSGDWVTAGDIIEYKTHFEKPSPSTFELDIVYVDDHLLLINKPPGLRSSGNGRSLQSELMAYPLSTSDDALFYPYLAHRLDRQTCGLIVAARTMTCRRLLGDQIDQHQLVKEYSLIVAGHFTSDSPIITTEIDGKSAKTEILSIRHLDTKNPSSYIRVRLHTGRTHQIRKHFQSAGHPIVGDDVYNKDGLTFSRGVFLMADYLKFEHPISGILVEMKVPLHKKFLKYL